MVKRPAKSILPLILAAAVIGALLLWLKVPQTAPIQVVTEPSPVPSLVQTAQAADGKISLELNQKQGAETTTWSLTAAQPGAAAKRIWSEALPHDTTVSIPFNAVSPDNKFLFLKQAGPDKTRYLALTTGGEPLAQDSPTVEFAGLFEAKHPDYQITAVTGWGGINLIVFNTDKINGGTGPSFWFDLSGHSFIRLSNRFD